MDGQIGEALSEEEADGIGWCVQNERLTEKGKRERCIWLASQCDILTGEAFVLANLCSSQQEK